MQRAFALTLLTALWSATPVSAVDDLEMLSAVFVGNPSRNAIDRSIRRVLSNHNVEATPGSMMHVADAVVYLRKETGIPEMDTLLCAGEVELSSTTKWTEAVALCATMMKANR